MSNSAPRTSIPRPRAVLTSLLSAHDAAADPPTTTAADAQPRPSLSRYHAHLATLHVLYPSTVLPALDVLDRRLVTRVVAATAGPADDDQHRAQQQQQQEPHIYFYTVRSAQPPKYRGSGPHKKRPLTSQAYYVVRTASWSCTCPAFAFAAAPSPAARSGGGGGTGGLAARLGANPAEEHSRVPPGRARGRGRWDIAPSFPRQTGQRGEAGAGGGNGWQFGGLSRDGLQAEAESPTGTREGVPCCKHLLACILAERWPDELGTHIEQQHVTRVEGAGLAVAGL